MGLLRGFKAKLTLKSKNKHRETPEIVCLRYHVNPDLYEIPPPVQEQNLGKHEVVKQRRTITKPVVQNIFNETASPPPPPPPPTTKVPKKSNLKKPKQQSNGIKVDDNRVSPLIHMTSDHGGGIEKKENEYIEILPVNNSKKSVHDTRPETDTLSFKTADNQISTAESLFFADVEPVVKTRPRNFHLTDYGDTLSQSSQTSA